MITEEQRAYSRKYYLEHRQEIRRNLKKSKLKHRIKIYKKERQRGTERKIAVLSYYSGGVPICARCGITDVDVLCIDHINGNGCRHRRAIGSQGRHFFRWLNANDYPSGYQVLCFNCNAKKYLTDLRENIAKGGIYG